MYKLNLICILNTVLLPYQPRSITSPGCYWINSVYYDLIDDKSHIISNDLPEFWNYYIYLVSNY